MLLRRQKAKATRAAHAQDEGSSKSKENVPKAVPAGTGNRGSRTPANGGNLRHIKDRDDTSIHIEEVSAEVARGQRNLVHGRDSVNVAANPLHSREKPGALADALLDEVPMVEIDSQNQNDAITITASSASAVQQEGRENRAALRNVVSFEQRKSENRILQKVEKMRDRMGSLMGHVVVEMKDIRGICHTACYNRSTCSRIRGSCGTKGRRIPKKEPSSMRDMKQIVESNYPGIERETSSNV